MRGKSILLILLLVIVAAGALLYWQSSAPNDEGEQVRMLAYVGYDEKEFLQPIEEDIEADIIVDTYVGGEQMYTKFTESPEGTYDILVLDAEYGERLFAEERILPLEQDIWYSEDLFPKFRDGSPARESNRVYAAAARWGALGLVFNHNKIPRSRVDSYDVIFAEDLQGKVGIYDWYLPNMGIISLSLGNQEPYDLGTQQLEAVRKELSELRPQITSLQPSPGQVIADLRNESVWLAPAIGEWAAAALGTAGYPIDWTVPKEGGIMWVEAFAISADSGNPELARSLLESVMKPEHLALLANREAYYSQVTRKSAYEHIPATVKEYLKADSLEALEDLSTELQFRHLPGPRTTEREWISVWTEFKAEN